jgi:hypothetical protein
MLIFEFLELYSCYHLQKFIIFWVLESKVYKNQIHYEVSFSTLISSFFNFLIVFQLKLETAMYNIMESRTSRNMLLLDSYNCKNLLSLILVL